MDAANLHHIIWDVGTDTAPVGDLPDRIDLLINNFI